MHCLQPLPSPAFHPFATHTHTPITPHPLHATAPSLPNSHTTQSTATVAAATTPTSDLRSILPTDDIPNPHPSRPRNPYIRKTRTPPPPPANVPTTPGTPTLPTDNTEAAVPIPDSHSTIPADDTPIPDPHSSPPLPPANDDDDSIDDPHPIPESHPHATSNPPSFTPDVGADLPSYYPTEADHLLRMAYGDFAHDNDGTHLSGAIVDDHLWQQHWLRIVQIHSTRFQPPPGKIGRRFLTIFTQELRGVRERRWNSERPLVFVSTILQTTPGVRRSKDIRLRLAQRMDLWEQGHYKALVDDTESEVLSGRTSSRLPSEDTIVRAYNTRVLSGRLRSAVRNLTGRSGGGILHPDEPCTKSGKPVWQVLQDKHPPLRDPDMLQSIDSGFEPYPALPTAIPICVTPDDVEIISSRLSGAAGPGGTDAVELSNWLLRFGAESDSLRMEMANWTNWLANTQPPWAAYRAMMANRLVALDKQPGTRPVGIGEIYRRLWAKCLLKAIGSQATEACGNYNLCAGLQAGIEGAIHAVRTVVSDPSLIPPAHPHPPNHPPSSPPPTPPDIADMPLTEALVTITNAAEPQQDEETSAALLIDAANGFNELGRKAMLWTVRHRWANGAQFSFNCYRHSAQLILRQQREPCKILLSREGVTQGDPLSMILYGLSLTPLAESLRRSVPNAVQPWYADDGAIVGSVSTIAKAQRLLLQLGPRRGYFPEPDKSILITPTG